MTAKPPMSSGRAELKLTSFKAIIDNADIQHGLLENETIAPRKLKAVGFKLSHLTKLNLIALELPNLSISDCILSDVDMSGSSVGEAHFERCIVKDCRLSGTQFYESTLIDVVFDGCKLDMANFRYSRLKRVEFHDCILVDVDFSGATLIESALKDSDLDKANFNGSKIEKLDLRGSSVAGVLGTNSLKNTTISADQLITLAPAMARDTGLIIGDD